MVKTMKKIKYFIKTNKKLFLKTVHVSIFLIVAYAFSKVTFEKSSNMIQFLFFIGLIIFFVILIKNEKTYKMTIPKAYILLTILLGIKSVLTHIKPIIAYIIELIFVLAVIYLLLTDNGKKKIRKLRGKK